MLPSVDCDAIRRAEERACHSIVRFEVKFNVVVVDMSDEDWAMAFRSSSLMFWLWDACTLSLCIGINYLLISNIYNIISDINYHKISVSRWSDS